MALLLGDRRRSRVAEEAGRSVGVLLLVWLLVVRLVALLVLLLLRLVVAVVLLLLGLVVAMERKRMKVSAKGVVK
jgi:hypothetical protein